MFTAASNSRKFDIHAHVLPENIPDFEQKFGYGGFIKLEHNAETGVSNMIKNGKLFREVTRNCFDFEERVKEMDKCRVNVQAVSTVPVMFHYWAKGEDAEITSRFLNDDLVNSCKKFPSRFVPLGTLPMQHTELAVQELRRCVTELNMPGFQIGSHVNEKNLDHPSLWPIYKAAEELDVCLFVHPWDMHDWNGRLNSYWMPWLVGMPSETAQAICCVLMGGILERFPRLRLCFAHGGGSYAQISGRVAHGFKVRPDLCKTDEMAKTPQTYNGKFWCDSLVHDPKVLHLLIELIGEEKICLGTDYPFPLGELEPGKVVEEYSDICKSVKLKENVLWNNALTLLNIKDGDQFETFDE